MNRETFARALDRLGASSALLTLRASRGSPWLTAITYHRAAHPDAVGDLEPGTVDVTPEALDRHLGYITRWFDVVGMDDVLAFRRGGSLPKNPILITFDDGYLDNHDVVLPLLQKHGARATFFIATSYIGERRLFWWDKIALFQKRSTKTSIELTYPARRTYSLADAPARAKTARALLRIVWETYGLDLPRYLDGLAAACGVTFSREEEREIADRVLMTWDHVRALRRAGMDVHSHTHTHRVLQTIDPATLEYELVKSREVLERELGEPVRAVSYPVGRPMHLVPAIRTAVKNAGYELGFSNETGTNHRWNFDPFDARRLAVDVGVSDECFRSLLALPQLVSHSH